MARLMCSTLTFALAPRLAILRGPPQEGLSGRRFGRTIYTALFATFEEPETCDTEDKKSQPENVGTRLEAIRSRSMDCRIADEGHRRSAIKGTEHEYSANYSTAGLAAYRVQSPTQTAAASVNKSSFAIAQPVGFTFVELIIVVLRNRGDLLRTAFGKRLHPCTVVDIWSDDQSFGPRLVEGFRTCPWPLEPLPR